MQLERKQLVRVRPYPKAVDAQEHITGRKSRPLIAVHKGMVDEQTFQQGACLLHYISIIATLRPEHSSLHCSCVAHTFGSAIVLNEYGIHAHTSAVVRWSRLI